MLSISRMFCCESVVHNPPKQQNNSTKPIPSFFPQMNNFALSTAYTQLYTRRFFRRINRLAVLFAKTSSLTTTTIKKV